MQHAAPAVPQLRVKAAKRLSCALFAGFLGSFVAPAWAVDAPLPISANGSSPSSPARSGTAAVDNNFSTRWEASNSSPGSYLTLTLQKPANVSQVKFYEFGKRIKTWQLQVFKLQGDATYGSWVTIASGGASTGPFQAVNLDSSKLYDGFRLYFPVKSNGQPSITEASIIGTSSPGHPIVWGATCNSTGTVNMTGTIYVPDGATFDGGCQTFVPSAFMEDCLCQAETTTQPVFVLGVGATLRNLRIGGNGADGVHTRDNASIHNVGWLHAKTRAVYSQGNLNLSYVTVFRATENAIVSGSAGKVRATNSAFDKIGLAAFRQRAATTFKSDFECDQCMITGGQTVFRTDSLTSTALITTSDVRVTPEICRGYAPGACTVVDTLMH